MDPYPVRVLVAERQPIVRRGLRVVLEEDDSAQIVSECCSGRDALRLAAEVCPDVALLGCRLADGPCVDGVRGLGAPPLSVPVLVLGDRLSPGTLRGVLDAGASGCLLLSEPLELLVEAVRGAAVGRTGWLSRELAARLWDEWRDPLTPQEKEVVRLLAEGRAAPKVAACLGISERTARNHLYNVYSKLDVHSQPELVAWAWRSGLAAAE